MEGKIDEALGEFRKLISRVAEEEGTVFYSLNVQKTDPNTLVVVEQYRDGESLKFHSSTSYFKEFFAKSASFVTGELKIEIMDEVGRI